MEFPKENNHTIFVEKEEEFKNFDPVKYFDTVPELLDQKYNRVKKDQLESNEVYNLYQHFSSIRNKINHGGLNIARIGEKEKVAYTKLADKIKNSNRMEEYFLKLDYEKQLMVLLKLYFLIIMSLVT